MTELRTLAEAARMLRCSPRQVQRLVAAGRLRPVYTTVTGKQRGPKFTDRELEAYVASLTRRA